ncbi:MAG: hypothetical protein ABSF99_12115 [Anaerolineales bacterium]
MLIFLPVILMLLTALALLAVRMIRPNYKYPWMIAAGGAMLAFVSMFLWQIHLPQSVTLPSWQMVTAFLYVPAWLADGISWPYALALASLAVAVIWTSVVRVENKPVSWAGTLTLTAFGILAVTAENPLTLLLAWSAIDLFELFTMLRSAEGKSQTEEIIIAFSVRIVGTGFLLWANLVSIAAGTPLDFRSTPQSTGIYLLIAAGLRLGVFPLHLPYRQENIVRRGFGTALRLVSAASGLALLARIPATTLKSTLTPYLLILVAIAALYAGWMWLNASDEILGRPFLILGFACLAVAESLRGNPTGSAGWGIALIFCGGVLFLFSARRRSILWMPFLGLWVFSTLPFSLTSSAWKTGNSVSWLFVIPFLPAQALLMAGFLRYALQPGETSLESQKEWSKVIYPTGLLILMATAFLLGFWGWVGASIVGLWWLAILVILLATGFTILAMRVLVRIPPGNISTQGSRIFRIEWLYHILTALYNFFLKIIEAITSAFEGEGGLLWSFLLLVLILSILSTRGH